MSDLGVYTSVNKFLFQNRSLQKHLWRISPIIIWCVYTDPPRRAWHACRISSCSLYLSSVILVTQVNCYFLSFSMTSCSVTATLYLELATKLLEHLFCKKHACRLSKNAVGGLTKLAQSAQRFLFAKQGRSTTFPDDEFLVAQCHLLLLVAQYSERHLPPEYQWPRAAIIIPQSLQHSCQTVQLVALEYLAHNPSAVDEVALQAVIDIVLHDNTDCDQDVLAKVCKFGCMRKCNANSNVCVYWRLAFWLSIWLPCVNSIICCCSSEVCIFTIFNCRLSAVWQLQQLCQVQQIHMTLSVLHWRRYTLCQGTQTSVYLS